MGHWDAAEHTCARDYSVYESAFCHRASGDRLSGYLTHMVDAVIFSILGRGARMTREEILQAIEDLTAQIRTLSYSSSKEAAAGRVPAGCG